MELVVKYGLGKVDGNTTSWASSDRVMMAPMDGGQMVRNLPQCAPVIESIQTHGPARALQADYIIVSTPAAVAYFPTPLSIGLLSKSVHGVLNGAGTREYHMPAKVFAEVEHEVGTMCAALSSIGGLDITQIRAYGYFMAVATSVYHVLKRRYASLVQVNGVLDREVVRSAISTAYVLASLDNIYLAVMPADVVAETLSEVFSLGAPTEAGHAEVIRFIDIVSRFIDLYLAALNPEGVDKYHNYETWCAALLYGNYGTDFRGVTCESWQFMDLLSNAHPSAQHISTTFPQLFHKKLLTVQSSEFPELDTVTEGTDGAVEQCWTPWYD